MEASQSLEGDIEEAEREKEKGYDLGKGGCSYLKEGVAVGSPFALDSAQYIKSSSPKFQYHL